MTEISPNLGASPRTRAARALSDFSCASEPVASSGPGPFRRRNKGSSLAQIPPHALRPAPYEGVPAQPVAKSAAPLNQPPPRYLAPAGSSAVGWRTEMRGMGGGMDMRVPTMGVNATHGPGYVMHAPSVPAPVGATHPAPPMLTAPQNQASAPTLPMGMAPPAPAPLKFSTSFLPSFGDMENKIRCSC